MTPTATVPDALAVALVAAWACALFVWLVWKAITRSTNDHRKRSE